MFLRHETCDVAARNLEIGLGQCHLDIGEEGLEEAPFPCHLVQHIAESGLPGRPDPGPDAKPTGHDLAGLGPAEHPGDRPEVLYAAHAAGTPRRPASEVEPAEL